MFYPKCPRCGGPSTSDEASLRYAKHAFAQWLQQQAAINHPHPWMKMAVMAGAAGYEVWKRVPGGGTKRCTSCGHGFK